MDMEVVEETMGPSKDQLPIIKGLRTKRQRPSSPFSLASSSSSGGGGDGHDQGSSSPSTEEEEDMANCLILLAQGRNKDGRKQIDANGRRNVEATISSGKDGLYVYQCKTCDRCFSSFQALGGHRASHKKPKPIVEEKKPFVVYEDEGQFNNVGNKGMYGNNKSKVHECSICGSEFSSGQALGGHMRRHRTPMATTHVTSESKKPRNILALDLNLPAPEEDVENRFPFTSKQQPTLLFSTSSLVDCHN